MVDDIIKTYKRASSELVEHGLNWYDIAHNYAIILSEEFNVPLFQTSGIIAACSINASWSYNINLAHDILDGKRKGLPVVLDKCKRILKTTNPREVAEILRGNKIKNFYYNIYNPLGSEVTIDRWTMRVVKFSKSLTNKSYHEITKAYQGAAERLGVLPHQAQAVTWGVIRGDLK